VPGFHYHVLGWVDPEEFYFRPANRGSLQQASGPAADVNNAVRRIIRPLLRNQVKHFGVGRP